jgi:hypothetical protein
MRPGKEEWEVRRFENGIPDFRDETTVLPDAGRSTSRMTSERSWGTNVRVLNHDFREENELTADNAGSRSPRPHKDISKVSCTFHPGLQIKKNSRALPNIPSNFLDFRLFAFSRGHNCRGHRGICPGSSIGEIANVQSAIGCVCPPQTEGINYACD